MNRSAETRRVTNADWIEGDRPISAVDEWVLVRRAQCGDRQAFERLVHRHDRHVLQLALTTFGDRDQARQVYLGTFRKVYYSIGRFRFDSSVCAWICDIARKVCTEELNKHPSRV